MTLCNLRISLIWPKNIQQLCYNLNKPKLYCAFPCNSLTVNMHFLFNTDVDLLNRCFIRTHALRHIDTNIITKFMCNRK